MNFFKYTECWAKNEDMKALQKKYNFTAILEKSHVSRVTKVL